MYIGKLADLTGATRKAIRHYESMGLIPSPQRKGNYRIYTEMDVHLVKMIRRAQSVGFNLAELNELATIKAKSGHFPIAIANRLITEKQKQLRQHIQEIEAIEQNLMALHEELNLVYGEDQFSEDAA
jgi:DNA-binding transcriptional MerR regulator